MGKTWVQILEGVLKWSWISYGGISFLRVPPKERMFALVQRNKSKVILYSDDFF